MKEIIFDAEYAARQIVEQHIAGFIMGAIFTPEGETEEEKEEDLCQLMADECAHWLVEDRLEGKLTPLQFNEVRNELAKLIGKISISKPY